MSNNNRRSSLATSLAFLTLSVAGTPVVVFEQALAQARSITYSTPQACSSGSVLSREECERAFRNAVAEMDEKAPRFDKRNACEIEFQRCMIGLASNAGSRRGVYFLPQIKAVRISLADKTVLPMPYIDHPAVVFDPRTILRSDEGQSGRHRAEAQARWEKRKDLSTDASEAAADPDVEPTLPNAGDITSWPIPANRRPKLIDDP